MHYERIRKIEDNCFLGNYTLKLKDLIYLSENLSKI